jgi:hypothetical protein
MAPHALKLADPNVIDEDLIRKCITTVEEIKLSEEKKKELKAYTQLHDIKVNQVVQSKKISVAACTDVAVTLFDAESLAQPNIVGLTRVVQPTSSG